MNSNCFAIFFSGIIAMFVQISIQSVYLFVFRCLGPEYQIPIVNNQGLLSTDQLYEIENEIASLLDAKVGE